MTGHYQSSPREAGRDPPPRSHGVGWIREEVTANTCFGTTAKVREQVDAFFRRIADRAAEVKQRCHIVLQASADALVEPPGACHVDPVAA